MTVEEFRATLDEINARLARLEDAAPVSIQMSNSLRLYGSRMALMETAVGAVDRNVDRLGARMDRVESRLDGIESRLDGIESRLDQILRRLSE